ncbi:polyprenyl synthetase family protein [Bartonella ancashensis]|uniref:Probable farnesyl diphosphate synthase n=1 Tax=Bartonella ancashensis TaxID=1318743 RepID=A0A0M3T2Q7_9HYPH|nr:farnesyl diphosphate synthase [Bartonella ancashensis]ALE03155.1 Octaprenyl-diphosphate synthase [Bartonella ancashensis]
MTEFSNLLAKHANTIEQRLHILLNLQVQSGEISRPEGLLNAIRYGVLSGGKCLRSFLVIQSGVLFGVSPEHSLDIGVALECVHCYSLIHDDLPAIDNDTLRRGKPTVHKKFGEATAILAGDALLTFAFEIIAHKACALTSQTRLNLITALSQAAGFGGMIGGQFLDVDAENKSLSPDDIATIQRMKTAALISFACQAGAILGHASEELTQQLADFGTKIGLAFQLTDDLLDVTSNTQRLGKTAGKDKAANKATFVSCYGISETQKKCEALIAEAEKLLHCFGDEATLLRQAANFIATRSS